MRRLSIAFAAAGVLTLAACAFAARTPAPASYAICNSAGCGDNVTFVITNDIPANK